MKKAQFVYVTYIKSTSEKVFQALTDPKFTRQYWKHENITDWKPGSKWEHKDIEDSAVDVAGQIVECDPPRRLVITWAYPEEVDQPDNVSRVTMEITGQKPGIVCLTVTHSELNAGSKMEKGISRGWPMVLSNLKTMLETGKAEEMW